MSGNGDAEFQATVAAQHAQMQAAQAQQQLIRERKEQQRIADRERTRAQRLLMRTLRASGGGFFETDPQTLGGSGALG